MCVSSNSKNVNIPPTFIHNWYSLPYTTLHIITLCIVNYPQAGILKHTVREDYQWPALVQIGVMCAVGYGVYKWLTS